MSFPERVFLVVSVQAVVILLVALHDDFLKETLGNFEREERSTLCSVKFQTIIGMPREHFPSFLCKVFGSESSGENNGFEFKDGRSLTVLIPCC